MLIDESRTTKIKKAIKFLPLILPIKKNYMLFSIIFLQIYLG